MFDDTRLLQMHSLIADARQLGHELSDDLDTRHADTSLAIAQALDYLGQAAGWLERIENPFPSLRVVKDVDK